MNRVRAHYGLVRSTTTPSCAIRRPATRTRWSSTLLRPRRPGRIGRQPHLPCRLPRPGVQRLHDRREHRRRLGHDGSPMAIFVDWMHSPPHRANILDPSFRDAGVGVARGFPMGGGRRRGDLHGRFRRPQASLTAKSRADSSNNRPENRVIAKSRAGSWRVSRHDSKAPDRDRGPHPDRRPLRRLRPGPSAQHPGRADLGVPAPDRPRGRARGPGAGDALHDQLRPRPRRPRPASATPPTSTTRRPKRPTTSSAATASATTPAAASSPSGCSARGYLAARCWRAGENIAWGTGNYASVRSIFVAWLHSPEHRANLLGRYSLDRDRPRGSATSKATARPTSGPRTSAPTAAPPRVATTALPTSPCRTSACAPPSAPAERVLRFRPSGKATFSWRTWETRRA